MKKTLHHSLVFVALLAALLAPGCASGGGKSKLVQFQASSSPDPELRPLIEGVDHIGVISTTNIKPFRELDIEKVMGQLSDATAHALSALPGKSVVTQDEIHWQLKDTRFDSTSIFDVEMHDKLRQKLDIHALVFIELMSLKARMTPVSPGPYGGFFPNPGVDMSVNLRISLVNLDSGEIWRSQPEERRNWQAVQLRPFNRNGGTDQAERQMLSTIAGPMQQFLSRIAPPPTLQMRRFELSGD